MAAAKAKVPPDLAREFEALGVPVVTHRLTRFKDARLREAAHLWLAEKRTAQDLSRREAEEAASRRSRRRFTRVAVAAVLLCAAALTVIIVFR